jgi:hypothetical protein
MPDIGSQELPFLTQGFFKKGNIAASRRSLAAWQPPGKPGGCFTRQKALGSQ